MACPAAMPNPDKERSKAILHQKLEAAKVERLPQGVNPGGENAGGKSSGSKVLKKPPPNFGGGVLGKK